LYKIIIIAVCIFLAFRLSASFHHAKRVPVKFDGTQVEFSFTDDYRMVTGVGEDISGKYLVVGASAMRDDQPGHLGVLPMAEVKRLTEKYGDFRKCDNPGAEEGKANVINMSVIAKDQKTKDALEQIAAQESRVSNLVIVVEGSRLELIKYYYRDEKEPQDAEHFTTNNEFYLIRSLAIDPSTK
jgi:hypothetical protein